MDACTSSATDCGCETVGLVPILCAMLAAFNSSGPQCPQFNSPSLWPRDFGPKAIRGGLKKKYDFIVVGAGSAGSVVASRLAENPKWSVLCIEAGGCPPMEEEVPGFRSALLGTRYDYQYVATSKRACLSYAPGCVVPLGKMIGGSHGHNGLLYLRGNPEDYDCWERMGNPKWGWNDVLPYFKKTEGNKNRSLNPKYHNFWGKLPIDDFTATDPINELLIAGAVEFGSKLLNDLNGGECLGIGHSQGTLYGGRRWTTAKTFLTPASRRRNLDVIKNAVVKELLFKGKKVTGVRFTYNGTHELVAKSRKDVILSAGAISSPQILLLSGIGPRKELEKLNIPVKCDLPGVGKNLQDHPTVPLFFKFTQNNTGLTPDEITLRNLYELVVNNGGPFAGGVNPVDLNAFIKTETNGKSKCADIQLTFKLFNRNTPNLNLFLTNYGMVNITKAALLAQNVNHAVVYVGLSLLKEKSRGCVSLRTLSINDQPNIDYNYLDHSEDTEILMHGIKKQMALTKTRAYQTREGEVIWPPLPACDCLFETNMDDYLRCYIAELTSTIYHPVGTCRMGVDSYAVVDSRLRVKGVKGLRVIDASIMPVITSGNTNAPTIMIAEKGADFAKSDWSDSDD